MRTRLMLHISLAHCEYESGTHSKTWGSFHEQFSIVLHILCKFHSALIQIVVEWPLWNFVHGMTTMLSWHVQNFVAIWNPQWNYTKTNFSSNLNYNGKIVLREMGPWLVDHLLWLKRPDHFCRYAGNGTNKNTIDHNKLMRMTQNLPIKFLIRHVNISMEV